MPQDFPQFQDGDELQPWHLNLFSRALKAIFGMQVGPGLALEASLDSFKLRLDGRFEHNWIARTRTGGINGRSGDQCGEGIVDLFRVDEDGKIQNLGIEARAFNLDEEAIPGDTWVKLDRLENGRLLVSPFLGGGDSELPDVLGRCDCPEAEYEVRVNCGSCASEFGLPRKMPKYWRLTIGSASLRDGEAECGLTCASAASAGRIKLTHVGGCTWEGKNGCVFAELTSISEDEWQLTLTDREDCVLAVLTTDNFACCGVTSSWTVSEGSTCDVSVSLAPHECTCCPPEFECPGDPDEGEIVTCPEVCCQDACTLTARWNASCVGTTCPEPPGSCVPEPTCTSSGEQEMKWIGGCEWYGESETQSASWTKQEDGSWKLVITVIVNNNTCTFVFNANEWECLDSPTLERAAESMCQTGTLTASIDPIPAPV